MKIGIDARFYGITGIGRYAQNLIRELEKIDQKNEYVVFLWKKTFDKYQPHDPRFKKVLADYPLYSFLEQLMMPISIWRQRVDLMHFTNFNVPVLYFGKYVVTIHDLIHQEHSTFGSTTRFKLYYLFKRLIYSWAIRWTAWRARKVIVPSEDAKKDMVEKLRVSSEKVVVTYEGLDVALNVKSQIPASPAGGSNVKWEEVLDRYGIKKPYLLYVATMYPHKNHERLLQAFRQLIDENDRWSNLQLVLVGKVDFFSDRVKRQVEELGLSQRVILPGYLSTNGYTPDEDLRVLYQHAVAYVFPSLKEGFGIPILEAWSAGLPVVASNASSIPEVGGDAVLYFDPYNTDDITKKIKRIITDEKLRRDLVEKGQNRLKTFSWNKMAKETASVYRESLSKPTS